MKVLLVEGSVLIILSLVLAWILTGIRILNVEALKRIFPAHDSLVKAHIDYILMALLLYAFYLLAEDLPIWVIGTMAFGAAVNPSLFVLVATKKPEEFNPGAVFKLITFTSFVLATIGFTAAAVLVAI